MSDLSQSFTLSASGMRAQAGRLRLISENLANVDTPGYRRKTASFEQAYDTKAKGMVVQQSRTRLDQSALERVHDPSHPMAGPDGFFEGSNVNMITEIADAREAQRSYEANVKIFEQTRKMSTAVLDILRR